MTAFIAAASLALCPQATHAQSAAQTDDATGAEPELSWQPAAKYTTFVRYRMPVVTDQGEPLVWTSNNAIDAPVTKEVFVTFRATGTYTLTAKAGSTIVGKYRLNVVAGTTTVCHDETIDFPLIKNTYELGETIHELPFATPAGITILYKANGATDGFKLDPDNLQQRYIVLDTPGKLVLVAENPCGKELLRKEITVVKHPQTAEFVLPAGGPVNVGQWVDLRLTQTDNVEGKTTTAYLDGLDQSVEMTATSSDETRMKWEFYTSGDNRPYGFHALTAGEVTLTVKVPETDTYAEATASKTLTIGSDRHEPLYREFENGLAIEQTIKHIAGDRIYLPYKTKTTYAHYKVRDNTDNHATVATDQTGPLDSRRAWVTFNKPGTTIIDAATGQETNGELSGLPIGSYSFEVVRDTALAEQLPATVPLGTRMLGPNDQVPYTIYSTKHNHLAVTYTSSDPEVLGPDGGYLKALKPGTVTLSANDVNGNDLEVNHQVTVNLLPTTIFLEAPTLYNGVFVGQTFKPTAKGYTYSSGSVTPNVDLTSLLTLTSSNEEAVAIENGQFKTLAPGRATLTASFEENPDLGRAAASKSIDIEVRDGVPVPVIRWGGAKPPTTVQAGYRWLVPDKTVDVAGVNPQLYWSAEPGEEDKVYCQVNVPVASHYESYVTFKTAGTTRVHGHREAALTSQAFDTTIVVTVVTDTIAFSLLAKPHTVGERMYNIGNIEKTVNSGLPVALSCDANPPLFKFGVEGSNNQYHYYDFLNAGTATVTATDSYGNILGSCQMVVKPKSIGDFTFEPLTYNELSDKILVTPPADYNKDRDGSINYSSSDPTVIDWDAEQHAFVFKKVGKATITAATGSGNLTAENSIEVQNLLTHSDLCSDYHIGDEVECPYGSGWGNYCIWFSGIGNLCFLLRAVVEGPADVVKKEVPQDDGEPVTRSFLRFTGIGTVNVTYDRAESEADALAGQFAHIAEGEVIPGEDLFCKTYNVTRVGCCDAFSYDVFPAEASVGDVFLVPKQGVELVSRDPIVASIETATYNGIEYLEITCLAAGQASFDGQHGTYPDTYTEAFGFPVKALPTEALPLPEWTQAPETERGSDAWYDLTGRCVVPPLRQGLYVHRGRLLRVR